MRHAHHNVMRCTKRPELKGFQSLEINAVPSSESWDIMRQENQRVRDLREEYLAGQVEVDAEFLFGVIDAAKGQRGGQEIILEAVGYLAAMAAIDQKNGSPHQLAISAPMQQLAS